jgi:hypothetical protein
VVRPPGDRQFTVRAYTVISYTEKTITLAGRVTPIARFAVWFRTPSGLFSAFEEARDHCVALDQNTALYLAPVAVALGEDGTYEEIPR